jgi:hypothetical protein
MRQLSWGEQVWMTNHICQELERLGLPVSSDVRAPARSRLTAYAPRQAQRKENTDALSTSCRR